MVEDQRFLGGRIIILARHTPLLSHLANRSGHHRPCCSGYYDICVGSSFFENPSDDAFDICKIVNYLLIRYNHKYYLLSQKSHIFNKKKYQLTLNLEVVHSF